MKNARQGFWEHTLVSSCTKGNKAEPEIAYEFPETYRESLQAYFRDMGEDLESRSQCLVYCFNQSFGRQPYGCGLRDVQKQWWNALNKTHDDEHLIVCMMTQANETYSRTKWKWFTCEKKLFPAGDESPWIRGLECEVALLDESGDEITTDIIPLSGGFGISSVDFRYHSPVVMLGPAWIDHGENRNTYVPKLTFPRRIELSTSEAASIISLRCAVRPRTYEER